jgi:hypothetical protein
VWAPQGTHVQPSQGLCGPTLPSIDPINFFIFFEKLMSYYDN